MYMYIVWLYMYVCDHVWLYGQCLLVCSDMYLAVGDQEKALEIMADNGWIDRSALHMMLWAHVL